MVCTLFSSEYLILMTTMTQTEIQKNIIMSAIEDIKAVDPIAFYVSNLVGYTDWIVITTGTSSRHVKAISDKAEIAMKNAGFKPLGSEGAQESEWILIDFGDVILHVLSAEMRDFYQLEKLFS